MKKLQALLLLALAIFINNAPHCGFVGQQLTRATLYLFGTFGMRLIVFVLGAVAGGLAGLDVSIGRALVAIRKRSVNRRHEQREVRKAALSHELDVALNQAAQQAQLTPSARLKISDVHVALKNFGYRREEYEPLLAKMNLAQPLEILVKSALKDLRKN